MKELNKLFSDIEFQYQDESNNHKKLKYVNIHSKSQKLLFYHYQLDCLLFQYLLF